MVERKHQHLLNVARALLFQSQVPIHFWGDCIMTTTYIINIIPMALLNNITPYIVLYDKEVDYIVKKFFGCLCYASTLIVQMSKFDPRAMRCLFLGYPTGVKEYKLYDIQKRHCFVSCDVVFLENHFPFLAISLEGKDDIDMTFADFVLPIPAIGFVM